LLCHCTPGHHVPGQCTPGCCTPSHCIPGHCAPSVPAVCGLCSQGPPQSPALNVQSPCCSAGRGQLHACSFSRLQPDIPGSLTWFYLTNHISATREHTQVELN
jgi:hypothetical protein